MAANFSQSSHCCTRTGANERRDQSGNEFHPKNPDKELQDVSFLLLLLFFASFSRMAAAPLSEFALKVSIFILRH